MLLNTKVLITQFINTTLVEVKIDIKSFNKLDQQTTFLTIT